MNPRLPMKLLPILSLCLALAPLVAVGEDAFFFHRAGAVEKRVEGDELRIVIPIKKMDPPKASAIYVARQDLGRGRKYHIQIDIAEPLPYDWKIPMIKLGDDVIDGGMHFGGGEKPDLHVESDDLEKIKKWSKLLAKLLKIPEDEIEMDLRSSEERREAEKAMEEEPAR